MDGIVALDDVDERVGEIRELLEERDEVLAVRDESAFVKYSQSPVGSTMTH